MKKSKGSDAFKQVIQSFLLKRAEEDSLFAITLQKEGKNINDCITYILNTVQKSNCNGFADEEIFDMAVHYYDENDIKIGDPLKNYQIIVNHVVELTPEEIEEAKGKAKERLIQDEMNRMKQPTKKPVAKYQAPTLPEVEEEIEEDDSFDPDNFEIPKKGTVPKKDTRKPVPMKTVQGSLF